MKVKLYIRWGTGWSGGSCRIAGHTATGEGSAVCYAGKYVVNKLS